MEHWVLTADQMGYDDYDVTLGVFGSRDAAVKAHRSYVEDAIERHPSNTALLKDDFSIVRWHGREELEWWVKRGANDWREATNGTREEVK